MEGNKKSRPSKHRQPDPKRAAEAAFGPNSRRRKSSQTSLSASKASSKPIGPNHPAVPILSRSREGPETKTRLSPVDLKASADSWKNHVGAFSRRESLLADAEELAGMGSWEFDLVERKRKWSNGLLAIMEVDLDRKPNGVDLFWSRVHPGDRESVHAAVDRAIAERCPFKVEFRANLPSGRQASFMVKGRALYNRDGRPVCLAGVTWDITAQKEREERLSKREALLAQAEGVANLGTWHHDFRSDTITASEYLLKIYGLRSNEEWEQKLHWTRVNAADHASALKNAERARRECGTYNSVLRYHHPDGRLRTLNLRCVSLPGPDGKPLWAIGVTMDITVHAEREEGLRKNQELLSHAERIANFGSWEHDFATGKTAFSKHLLAMWGMSSESEWEAESHWQRIHPGDRKVRQSMRKAWAEGQPFSGVMRFRRPDGVERILHQRGLTVKDSSGKPVGAIGVVQDVTGQRETEEELRRLSCQLIQTRDSERRRLARELHESAGQSLAALKMTLGCIRDQLPPESGVPQLLLQSSAELADEAIREVRTISYLIHPPMLDEAGLGLALRLYLKGFSQRSGIQVVLEGDETFGRSAQEAEITLFRIVQEALTNVHRHSGSSTAQVRLLREDQKLIVEITDQGRGLPEGRGAAKHGVGISGMLERMKHLKGEIEFSSNQGHGTIIRAMLPDMGDASSTGSGNDRDPELGSYEESQDSNSSLRNPKDAQETTARRRGVVAR